MSLAVDPLFDPPATLPEAAARLRVTRAWLAEQVLYGRLPADRKGDEWYLDMATARAYIGLHAERVRRALELAGEPLPEGLARPFWLIVASGSTGATTPYIRSVLGTEHSVVLRQIKLCQERGLVYRSGRRPSMQWHLTELGRRYAETYADIDPAVIPAVIKMNSRGKGSVTT